MKKTCFIIGIMLAAMLTGCAHYDFEMTLDGKKMSRIYYAAGKKKVGGAGTFGYYKGPGVAVGYFDPRGLENGTYTIEYVGFMNTGSSQIEVFGKLPPLPKISSVKCSRCDGSGLVECDTCRSCYDCNGTRNVKCRECDGSGKVRHWYYAWVKTECGKCHGDGTLPCSRCANCVRCEGTRKVKCPECVRPIGISGRR